MTDMHKSEQAEEVKEKKPKISYYLQIKTQQRKRCN